MVALKAIFNFYINASIHVALAVFSLVKITEVYFSLPDNSTLNFFIFFGTITGYNFVKYAGVAKLHHRSLTQQLKTIQIFSLLCFLFLCYYCFLIEFKTLLVSIPFTLFTIFYAVPLLSGFEKNLREISYLKIIVVAIVWSGFTVILPLIDAKKPIGFLEVTYALQRFLLVMVLILPFDIRDLKYDAISLQTLPQKMGVEITKRFGVGLLVLCLVLEYVVDSTSSLKTPFMLFFFLVLLLLMRAKTNQPKYYSSFWVEALPIAWWLLLLGFNNF